MLVENEVFSLANLTSSGTFLLHFKSQLLNCYYPAVVAEWVYERLQIQVAVSHRSQVQIPLGTCNYDGEIVTKIHNI